MRRNIVIILVGFLCGLIIGESTMHWDEWFYQKKDDPEEWMKVKLYDEPPIKYYRVYWRGRKDWVHSIILADEVRDENEALRIFFYQCVMDKGIDTVCDLYMCDRIEGICMKQREYEITENVWLTYHPNVQNFVLGE